MKTQYKTIQLFLILVAGWTIGPEPALAQTEVNFDSLGQGAFASEIATDDSSRPSGFVSLGGAVFFFAVDGGRRYDLWKTDGTEPGTVKIKDDIGPAGLDGTIFHMERVNDVLLFVTDDGVHGWELWKSDGTVEGTALVKDIDPGMHNGTISPSFDEELDTQSTAVLDGEYFFTASNTDFDWELWKSDGTEAGTRKVKDIDPVDAGSFPEALTLVNGTLFFGAIDGDGDRDLWKSDGTEGGTRKVREIDGLSNQSLTAANDILFFTAVDGSPLSTLWRSDGTEAGTMMVQEPGSSVASHPTFLTNVNGTLFFRTVQGLWKSDGTSSGTLQVKNIVPVITVIPTDRIMVPVGGTLFFAAREGNYGTELWKSDGTEEGTVLVKDIYIGPDPDTSSPHNLTDVNGTLFFNARDAAHGHELWKSDGTAEGTVMVRDIYPGPEGSDPDYLANCDGVLFFGADDGVHGHELWMSDGTEAGTIMVKDINLGPNGGGEGEGESDEGGEGEGEAEGESDEGGEGDGEAEGESAEDGEGEQGSEGESDEGGEGEEEGGDDGVCPASSLISGGPSAWLLEDLRRLRDLRLMGNSIGSRFMGSYYTVGAGGSAQTR